MFSLNVFGWGMVLVESKRLIVFQKFQYLCKNIFFAKLEFLDVQNVPLSKVLL